MNCRTYPRNSVLAFPRTLEYAASIERPQTLWQRIRFIFWSK